MLKGRRGHHILERFSVALNRFCLTPEHGLCLVMWLVMNVMFIFTGFVYQFIVIELMYVCRRGPSIWRCGLSIWRRGFCTSVCCL